MTHIRYAANHAYFASAIIDPMYSSPKLVLFSFSALILAIMCVPGDMTPAVHTVHAIDASSTNFFAQQKLVESAFSEAGTGLQIYFDFDDFPSTVVSDKSGRGADGTLVANRFIRRNGQYKGGIGFNLSPFPNFFVSKKVPEITGALTVSAWFMPTTTQAAGSTIAVKGSEATYSYLLTSDTSNHILFSVRNTVPTTLTVGNVAGTILTNGIWYHIAGVYDGTSTAYVYINGVQADMGSSAGLNALFSTAGQALYIQGNTSTGFRGDIDEFRLYNRALSASEIASMYAQGPDFGRTSAFTDSFATSTSFKSIGATGGIAIGTSTSATFGLLAGFMRNMFTSVSPLYTQIHYHWRNDDGSETTATSKTSGVEDTVISSLAKSTTVRLRIEVSNEGGTRAGFANQQFRLEYGLKVSTCSSIVTWTDVGAVGGDWDMANSTNLTEGAHTTNISVGSGGVSDANKTFLATNAGVKDTSSTVASLSVPSDSFAELEYSIAAQTAATDAATYCFRVTNAGSATSYVYTAYPEATLASGTTLTFVLDGSSEAFPTVTPGTISATSSILFVKTNNTTGFVATIQRADATGTMSKGTVYIPDKTAWSPGISTTTAGNATASTTQPLTLQFRVRQAGTDVPNYASAWWGTGDTTAAALFAGIPSSAQTIVNRSTAALATTTSYVLYNLNVPATQETGAYSGSVTYTVTANP